MGFTVLGPVALVIDGERHTVARAQTRGLLALLLLEAGRTLSLSAIIEAMWSGAAPRTARSQVQMAVHAIRRMLALSGAEGILEGGSFGYRLVVDIAATDLGQFDTDVAEAQLAAGRGDDAEAATLLRRGLARWQGEPLADAAGAFVEAARARLTDRRLGAVADLADIELRLGRHEALIDDLAALVLAHPMREAIRARLMLALYRGGRQVEALQTYRDYRLLLAEQEGIEPGPELSAMQLSILRADARLSPPGGGTAPPAAPAAAAPTVAVPAQLPADVSAFTGRRSHLDQLDAAIARMAAQPSGALVITTIVGTAGVGKTALAVHWAHRARGRFPDGQVSVDLRGFAPGASPLRPIDALARLLDALGVRPDRVPAEVDQAASLYRTVTAERSLLVLLDNARDADQVRPLLPGGPGCLVIVTSRDHLAGLVAREGATRIPVDVLGPEEAATLLATLLGAERVAAEPKAAAELAQLCSYLPLALRIAAANLTVQGYATVAEYVTSLRERDRVGALAIQGDPSVGVRATFDLSYEAQPAAVRRLFRLLSRVPGPDLDAAGTAALLDTSTQQAAALVDELVRAHLVHRLGPDRFGCHDLLRNYAAQLCEQEDPAGDRTAASARLYEHYLRRADAAATLLYPQTVRLPGPERGPQSEFDDEAQASAWLAAESANLAAVITRAAAEGPGEVAWRLADTLRGHYWLSMRLVDWLGAARTALEAAEAAGDVRARAAGHLSLAHLNILRGSTVDAIREGELTLELSREGGWLPAEATANSYLGIALWQSGQPDPAITRLGNALRLSREIRNWQMEAVIVGNLGVFYSELGRLTEAHEHQTQALALSRKMASRSSEALALVNLGQTLHDMGETGPAHHHLAEGLATHREIGNRHGEVSALRCLAELALDTGEPTTAIEVGAAAVALARDTNNRRQLPISIGVLADIYRAVGDHERATELCQEALAIAREMNDSAVEAHALIVLAETYADTGEGAAAVEAAERALALAEAGSYAALVGRSLAALARGHLACGEADAAGGHARRAVHTLGSLGHRRGEAHAQVVLGDALCEADGPAAAAGPWRAGLALLQAAGSPAAAAIRRRLTRTAP